jgi:hypothetical protein
MLMPVPYKALFLQYYIIIWIFFKFIKQIKVSDRHDLADPEHQCL